MAFRDRYIMKGVCACKQAGDVDAFPAVFLVGFSGHPLCIFQVKKYGF
jgi:hypothetical protein